MRLLHVSDIHLHRPWMDWVSSAASSVDAVILAGDLMNGFSNVALREQMRLCRDWIVRLPVPTLVASGNHDHWMKDRRVSVDVAAEGGWIRHLRGQGNVVAVDGDMVKIGSVSVAVAGWLHPRWPVADVVVYHAPPAGSICAGSDGRDVGDPEATDQLREHSPRIYLSGHIHAGKSWCWWPPADEETLILVPGCGSEDEPPAHWVVDFATSVATHHPSGVKVIMPSRP
jgi:Icc-related predicted phosphoesterase